MRIQYVSSQKRWRQLLESVGGTRGSGFGIGHTGPSSHLALIPSCLYCALACRVSTWDERRWSESPGVTVIGSGSEKRETLTANVGRSGWRITMVWLRARYSHPASWGWWLQTGSGERPYILGCPQKKKTNQEDEDIQAGRQVTMLPTQSVLSFLLRITINQRVRTRNKKCSCQVMWRELNKETIYKGVRGMQEDPATHLPGMVRAKVLPVFSLDKACGPMLHTVTTLGCVPRNRHSTPLLSPPSHFLPIHPIGWTYREAND